MLQLLLVALFGVGAADPFEQLKSLVGTWDATLPSGRLTNTVRLVSNGKAIEETIGTTADNETSIYTRDKTSIQVTHFCAMTPEGHQVKLATPPLDHKPWVMPNRLDFAFVSATNLPSDGAPHMRGVSLTIVDHDHFTETWTKSENGEDIVFDLVFTRRGSGRPAKKQSGGTSLMDPFIR